MKKLFYTTFMLLCVAVVEAQPTLQQSNMAAFNTSATLYGGPLVASGGSGANQTWDFSSTTFVQAGTALVFNPALIFSSQFPTANYSYRLNIGSNVIFVVYNLTTSLLEFVANGVDANGNGGDNYTPNPKSEITFPYNFNDVVQDNWERTDMVTGSTTRTYDAYGTLITPYGTFNNVVRQASTSGGGPMYYTWYTTNPILPVMSLNPENNSTTLIIADPTGVATTINTNIHSVFPNPATNFAVVDNIGSVERVEMFDAVGRMIISHVKPTSGLLDISNVNAGVYSIRVTDQNGNVGIHKLIVQ